MRHELHLMRVGFLVLVPVALVTVAVAAVAAGPRGALSAAAGMGLVVANHLVAALSTGWAPVLTPGVAAVGYAGFVVRMLALLAAFAVLSSASWIVPGAFAGAFGVGLVVVLTAECVSYARGSFVPDWRTR
jgi:hypothetical protein